MFIFNFKINKNLFSKIAFIIMLIVILSIFIFGVYIIFIKRPSEKFTVSDSIKSDNVFEIDEENYTNILKASNENIDSYIGVKVHLKGYVYRLLDFNKNQFVAARDMTYSKDNSNSLIVGFLCEYNKCKDFKDGEWVDIVGEIQKGDFNGEIAILNIISIERTEKPENPFVNPPDETYIPTSNMF